MIPELEEIGATRRVLPLGRYLTTLDEIQERYVSPDDVNRCEIYNDFLMMIQACKEAFGSICAVWIGGSFITSEREPHDIDVVLLIHEEAYQRALKTSEGQFIIRCLGTKHGFGPRVDAFMVDVHPLGIDNDRSQYLNLRGYWDQFWSKARFENEEDMRCLYPAAGYLEVMLDGYIA